MVTGKEISRDEAGLRGLDRDFDLMAMERQKVGWTGLSWFQTLFEKTF